MSSKDSINANAAGAASPREQPMRVDISSPGGSEISDTLPETRDVAATSTERPSVPGTRTPVRTRTMSRDPQREEPRQRADQADEETVNVKDMANTIKELQNMMKNLQDDLTRIREENQLLKNGANMNIGQGDNWNSNMKPLHDIDKKDVEKPGKFKGDPLQWRGWSMKFTTFLTRRDPRWQKLVKIIQEKSDAPIGDLEERQVFKDMGINVLTEEGKELAEKFKEQFQEYLENFTDGSTRTMVQAAGVGGVLEAFRLMCDDNHSKRKRHLKREYRAVTNPKQATFDNLRQAIANWETEIVEYQTASGITVDDRTRLLCLEDLCPDLLQQHIASKENLTTYAGYKTVINDYLIERKRWTAPNTRGKINWLGVQESPEEAKEDTDDWENNEGDVDGMMNEVRETLMALVKSKFQKGAKGGKGLGKSGGGKGGKGDSGKRGGNGMEVDDPVCFECGESMKKCGHSAKDCPVRKARMAAGGPERLPKGGGKGTGKKGNPSPWPTRTAWNNYYPGPSQSQWKNWYPQPSPGAPPGKVNLFEQPLQLSNLTPLQTLLNGPSCYAIRPRDMVKSDNKPNFVHKNKFEALDTEGISDHAMRVNLMDAVKKPSPNRVRKTTGATAGTSSSTPSLTSSAKKSVQRKAGGSSASSSSKTSTEKTLLQAMLDFVNRPVNEVEDVKSQVLRMINPKPDAQGLRPIAAARGIPSAGGDFEVLSSIVDSGATVPVMHPEDAKEYDLMESEASRGGVEYEVANCDFIPNLGEKKFAVITTEGTLRGYQTQCAEVGRRKPLQAVRALLASNHAVCFGLGDQGLDHLIINKTSGEINRMRDDGVNYIQDMLVVPPNRIEEVQQQLLAMQNGDDDVGQDFGGQGR